MRLQLIDIAALSFVIGPLMPPGSLMLTATLKRCTGEYRCFNAGGARTRVGPRAVPRRATLRPRSSVHDPHTMGRRVHPRRRGVVHSRPACRRSVSHPRCPNTGGTSSCTVRIVVPTPSFHVWLYFVRCRVCRIQHIVRASLLSSK